MASLVTDSRFWTYLRCFMTRMNTIVRSVITCRQDARVADPEQGASNNVPQQEIRVPVQHRLASDKFGDMFSKTKMHDLFRSLLRMNRLDTSDVDIEKADDRSDSTKQEGICTTNNLTPSTIKNGTTSNHITQEVEALPVSPSLSISSILDMMPIPVTTPHERALAASILASCNASPPRPTRPTRPITPPFMSPSSLSSPGTSFFADSTASTTLNTPPPTHEPMIFSTKPTLCSTPFLEQHSRFIGVSPCDLSVTLSMSSIFDPSEEYDIYGHQGRRTRWTGNPGFMFPVNCGNGLFRVVEEEEECEDPVYSTIVEFQPKENEVSGTLPDNGSVVSDSPWDDGELESYGMKGKASWVKSLDSEDDQFYAWIKVEN